MRTATLLRAAFLALLMTTAAGADPIRVVSLPANDLVYDPATKKIYASVPSSAGSMGNTITAIDPETGQIGPSVPIGSEPGKLVIADLGRTIYAALDGAAAARRFDTVTGTAGLRFSLGNGYGPNYADDLAVVPGHPDRVAISLYNKGISPNGVGVFIFENGVPLPKFVKGVNALAYSDRPDRLYGYDNQSTGFGFLRMNADDTGIPGGDWRILMTGFGVRIQFEGGRVYDTSGGVWDPEAGILLGHLPGGVTRPDSQLGRVFILQGDGPSVRLAAYDASAFTPLWSAKIAGVSGSAGSLIRWGADGLAFRSSGGQVFLLHTGEISAAPADFSLTLNPAAVAGEATVLGAIALAAPAPAGGLTFQLASSSPGTASAPPSVIAAAGATTVAFPITARVVAARTDVTLTATAGGLTHTATLRQEPPPASSPPSGPASPVYNPANGHWYQEVRLPNKITWPDAKAAAEQLSFAGFPGHLATVTSAAENQFVSNYMTAGGPLGDIWIGGYQDHNAPDFGEPAGGWRWVTGEPWSYTSWSQGEPNNGSGGEDVLETNSGGTWNDLIPAPGVTAYLVEYEPPAVPVPATAGAPQLALFPNPVPGGLLALGQVILPQPAGPEGVAVSLNSSSPTVALVPASLVVLPGAASVTFPIITFPVPAATSVTITASGAFGTATAVLQVLPLVEAPSGSIGPPQLTFLTNLIESGVTATGQIALGRPAPADFVVTLSSSNPGAAEAPPTVTVPAGSAVATFSVVTHVQTSDTPVTVTASAAAGSSSASLQLLAVTAQPGFPAGHEATGPVYNPATGHWYQDARGPNLTWENARAAAASLSYNGLPGHLATLTSPEESDFLIRAFIQGTPGGYEWWLGGYQDTSVPDYVEPAGGWRWVTGEPWSYTHWAANQPDNAGSGENTLEIYHDGTWNDRPNDDTLGGYFVEYEPAAPTQGVPGAAPAPPPTPTNLTARLLPGPAVQLSWQDNSADESAFAVWRRTGSGDWVRVAVLAPNTTTFLDPNAAAGMSYVYRVRATRGNVASGWSNEASVTTP